MNGTWGTCYHCGKHYIVHKDRKTGKAICRMRYQQSRVGKCAECVMAFVKRAPFFRKKLVSWLLL